MSKIVSITAQAPAFFTTERHRDLKHRGAPFWRGLVRMKRPDRLRIQSRLDWAADIVHYLERFMELPPLQLPSIALPGKIDDWDAIEAAAERVREEWGLGASPIRHLAALLESKGIILVRERVDCDDMDAVSVWHGSRPYILLADDKRSLPRENFDLAHELAHVLLHPHVEVTSENLRAIERQANYFAGALLLPRASFVREVISTSLDYFIELKRRWRVSIGAMVSRCKDLHIFNQAQVSYLWRQMSQRNMRKLEPLDDAFEPERPTLLAAALNMLVEHRVQSRAQILDSLLLNPSDVESLCSTEKGFLDDKVVQLNLRPRPSSA
jgi:Zn-dependent peptidase ImmA (M78 family)